MDDKDKISKILNESSKEISINIKKESEIDILENSLKTKEKEIKNFFNELLKKDL